MSRECPGSSVESKSGDVESKKYFACVSEKVVEMFGRAKPLVSVENCNDFVLDSGATDHI